MLSIYFGNQEACLWFILEHITKIFGYNNNVTIGNHNYIYYVTLYNTKGNQDEEQFPFLKHCTALAKRIRRLWQEEEEIEKQFGTNGGIRKFNEVSNFSIGLGHVLSGFIAHLSSTVQLWLGT